MTTESVESTGFVKYLYQLDHAGDRRALAELRRFVTGRPPSLASLAIVARAGAPLANTTALADYQLVSGLFAYYHRGSSTREFADGDFGWSFGRLVIGTESDGGERRFTTLLETRRGDLDDQLRRAVALLRSKGIAIDWTRLLDDVRRWNDPEHKVQDKWALSFVRITQPIKKEEE